MALSEAAIRAMVDAGCTAEQIAAVVTAELREAEAEQAARRERARDKKRRQRENLSPDVPGTGGDNEGQAGTNGDAPAPSPEKKEKSPQAPLKEKKQTPSPSLVLVAAQEPDPKPTPKTKRKSQISEDWFPDGKGFAYATEAGMSDDVAYEEIEKFKDHHRGKGNVMADWSAAWRNWVRNSVEIKSRRQQQWR